MWMDLDAVSLILKSTQLASGDNPKPGMDRIFMPGAHEAHISIYGQQVRALNLVAALADAKRLDPDDTIAIVGAGISGLTAALAARRLGFRVRLGDRTGEPFGVLKEVEGRWVHPRLFDFPSRNWSEVNAGLPVLNWEGGYIDGIRERWSEEVDAAALEIETIDPDHLSLTCEEGGVGVEFAAGERFPAAAVILATGYGPERKIKGADSRDVLRKTYWRGKPDVVERGDRSFYIVGCGDGGVQDAAYCLLPGFEFDQLAEDMYGLDDARTGLVELFDLGMVAPHLVSDQQYLDAAAGPGRQIVDAIAREAAGRHVTILSDRPRTITELLSPLNRLLLAAMLNAGVCEVRTNMRIKRFYEAADGTRARSKSGDEVTGRFLVRVGPKRNLPKIQGTPEIKRAMKQLRKLVEGPAQLTQRNRVPHWRSPRLDTYRELYPARKFAQVSAEVRQYAFEPT